MTAQQYLFDAIRESSLRKTKVAIAAGSDILTRAPDGQLRNKNDYPLITETRPKIALRTEEGLAKLLEGPIIEHALFKPGGDSTALLQYLFINDKLKEIFKPANWQDREDEATQLYTRIGVAVPEEFTKSYASPDLSSLRETSLSDSSREKPAVHRYVRNRPVKGEERLLT